MSDESSLLGAAGLSVTSEQVYLFVVHSGRVRPSDVVERFELAPDEAARVLAELHRQGLVTRSRGDETYAAIDPRSSLSALADRVSADARRIRDRIPTLTEQFERTLAHEAGSEESRVLTDPGEIAGWYVRLQHQVKEELVVFDRPPYFATALEPVETSMIARGVTWRGIYTPASFEQEGAWAEVARLAELGELGRVVPQLPVKLAIADRSVALLSLSLDGVRPDSLVTRSAPLVHLLHEVFETYWAHAIPVSPAEPAPPDLDALARAEATVPAPRVRRGPATRPTPEQQAILAMIGAGMTDEAIAARLGLSVRSLRRRSQRLMADLGAENRFQLGAEAARRGWV